MIQRDGLFRNIFQSLLLVGSLTVSSCLCRFLNFMKNITNYQRHLFLNQNYFSKWRILGQCLHQYWCICDWSIIPANRSICTNATLWGHWQKSEEITKLNRMSGPNFSPINQLNELRYSEQGKRNQGRSVLPSGNNEFMYRIHANTSNSYWDIFSFGPTNRHQHCSVPEATTSCNGDRFPARNLLNNPTKLQPQKQTPD